MPHLSYPELTAFSPVFVPQDLEPVVQLMSSTERLSSLQRMSAQLAYLADEARARSEHGLEAALIKTAAEVLTSAKEIAAAGYAPSFIRRLAEAIERIECGLDNSGALLRQTVAH